MPNLAALMVSFKNIIFALSFLMFLIPVLVMQKGGGGAIVVKSEIMDNREKQLLRVNFQG